MPGFNDLLGLTYSGLADDRYWIALDADERHTHDKGLIHGGVILALLDIAMSRAVRHANEFNAYTPTVELNTSFLRPIPCGPIRAWGMILHQSRSLVRADAAVLDASSRICATGRATFMRTAPKPD